MDLVQTLLRRGLYAPVPPGGLGPTEEAGVGEDAADSECAADGVSPRAARTPLTVTAPLTARTSDDEGAPVADDATDR